MRNLVEIQEAIEKLAPKERAELWDWFQAQEVEETDEMLAAVDEIYSPNAISDLAEIVRFVAQDDPQAALKLGEQLADDADSLARLPYRFPKFRRRANVRKLVTGQYLILYRIVQTAKVVEILRFWHGARETPRL